MPELLIVHPQPEDERGLRELWAEVFGDTEELIEGFFDTLYRPEYCRLARENGRVLSAGYCIPGPRAGEYRCAYIYAVATLPEARGRGLAAEVCRALCGDAFDMGADIVATLPASESLCSWYAEKLKMAPAFKKGGEGVEFPGSFRAFADICGEPDNTAPPRLYALCRPPIEVESLGSLGWEYCFD